MTDPSPTSNDEQERQRLFRDVWGDSAGGVKPRRSRPVSPESGLPVPGDVLPPPQFNGRVDQLERQVGQLQADVASLRRMTEEGLEEIRRTILRLAEAVQAARGRSGSQRGA